MRETRALSIAPSAMLAASARTDSAADEALDSVVDALAAKTFLLPVDHMRGGEGEPELVERAYCLRGAFAVEYSRIHKVVERFPIVAGAGVNSKAYERLVDGAAEERPVRLIEHDGPREARSHEACLFEFIFDLGK